MDQTPSQPDATRPETPRRSPITGPLHDSPDAFPPVVPPIPVVPPPAQPSYPAPAQGAPPQYAQGYGQPPQPLQSGPLPQYPPPGAMPPYPVPPQPRKGWPVWAWVIVGVVTLACLGCVGVSVLAGRLFGQAAEMAGPVLVATEYFSDLQVHNYEAASAFLSDDLSRTYTPEQLEVAWRTLEGNSTVKGMTFTNLSSDNGTTHLTWVVTVDSATYKTTLGLRQIGKEWKIVSGTPSIVPQR